MIKEKICKGHGKAKGFESCGSLVDVRFLKYGLCKSCYTKWLISDEPIAKKTFESFLVKNKRDFEKNVKKKIKQENQNRKSIQRLIQEARKPFHKWIRLRDINRSCISCGSVISEIWDAGHYFKAELYSGLIFDERNVHKQCRKCNTYLNGNESNYRIGLIQRYGNDFMKEIEDCANEKRKYIYTRDELISIKNHYLELLKTI